MRNGLLKMTNGRRGGKRNMCVEGGGGTGVVAKKLVFSFIIPRLSPLWSNKILLTPLSRAAVVLLSFAGSDRKTHVPPHIACCNTFFYVRSFFFFFWEIDARTYPAKHVGHESDCCVCGVGIGNPLSLPLLPNMRKA